MTPRVKIRRMAKKKPSAAKASPKDSPVVIYLELPSEKKELKAVMERLAGQHNRKLTGECIQALEDYARAHGLWVQQQPKPDAKKES
jgi:hypothetical protein